MIADEVRHQIRDGEGKVTAFVVSSEAFEEIAATLAAFLNTHGGTLFVGVAPGGIRVGIAGDLDLVRRTLEQRLRDAIVPRALFTVSVDAGDEPALVTIEAPRGRDGPYAVNGHYYVREGKRTVPAAPEVLDRILRERSIEVRRWERRPALELEEEDLDTGQIDTTLDTAERLGRLTIDDRRDLRGTLRKLGLTATGGLSQACDVLFARHPEQRHPQARVRFVRYATDKTGDRYLENDWLEGPIPQICDAMMERLSPYIHLISLFVPGDPVRRDRHNYSFDAVREGLVNALAHRDYASASGNVSVSVYPNRIEIWNTGRLPREIKTSDLRRTHPSIPTNPDITYVLYLRGWMERLGRGTQKILLGCRELGAQLPRWRSDDSGVTLTIYSSDASVGREHFNLRQIHLLERMRPGDAVRVGDYIADAGGPVSERQARRDLADLEAAGLLTKVGAARATAYRRTELPI